MGDWLAFKFAFGNDEFFGVNRSDGGEVGRSGGGGEEGGGERVDAWGGSGDFGGGGGSGVAASDKKDADCTDVLDGVNVKVGSGVVS